MVALDGSETSESALAFAGELARIIGARVQLVGVVPREDQEDATRAYPAAQADLFNSSGVSADSVVRLGDAATEIIAVVDQYAPAAVIMGTRGRTGLVRAVLGSVSGAVLHHTPMPVVLTRRRRVSPMLVEHVMTRLVVTVDAAANAQFALELLRNGGFRHLPVMEGGRMIGIVSDRDLVRTGSHILKDVMHTPVLTVSPTTPVEMAASILADNKISALPVTDPPKNRLVGIVSQTHLFVVLARLLHSDGPSTRLELQLANLPRDLEVVTSIAEQRGVPITSLVTIPPTPELSEWHRWSCASAQSTHAASCKPCATRACTSWMAQRVSHSEPRRIPSDCARPTRVARSLPGVASRTIASGPGPGRVHAPARPRVRAGRALGTERGLDRHGCRHRLCQLFASVGFRVQQTSEPNVAMHASNVLLVRIGSRVPTDRVTAFQEALFIAPWQRHDYTVG